MWELVTVILLIALAGAAFCVLGAFVALWLAGRQRWGGRTEAARRAAREQWRAEVEPQRGCWVRLKAARALERERLAGQLREG